MHYEAHITVDGRRGRQWVGLCKSMAIKPLRIQLEGGGAHPRQVMCTVPLPGGMDEEEARAAAYDVSAEVKRHGHRVLRFKLEAELRRAMPRCLYYEGHIKLALREGEATRLHGVAGQLGLAVSRSTMRDCGVDSWFLTDRCYVATPRDALTIFHESLEYVQEDYPEATMECEGVLEDTCPALDDGWLTIPSEGRS
jgi:hypothetical protein